MIEADERQAIIDDEHLKLLSIAYMVSGVMSAFMSMFGLLYAAMGAMFAFIPATDPDEMPPEAVGWLFGAFGGAMFVLLLALAIAKFRAASLLKQRRGRTFCMVVAGITCLGIPWGTMIGVCTFLVLGRDSMVRRFGATTPA